MKNDGLKKRHDLIQEYHFKLKELNAEKNAITKTINVIKERFEDLIQTEPDLEQLSLFDNMDDFLRERSQKIID
jgi:GTP1/Obg family GTP-binding protein